MSDNEQTDPSTADRPTAPRRVFVLGATGTIGRATVRALVERGHEVVCFLRARKNSAALSAGGNGVFYGASVRFGDVSHPQSLERDGFRGERFDVLLSCLASRTGAPKDAWAIDHQAHVHALHQAKAAGVTQFVLLSALCVQKPLLEFQKAKLAFEAELIGSGVSYSIVRPTAFFKSLSGQIDRVKRGKPYLLFGDGAITATKPISDRDLGNYLAECLDHNDRWNRILPIGGPGGAITPRQQGEEIFRLLGMEPKFKRLPVKLLDAVIAALSALGRLAPPVAAKAELARIGRYYATESMLVLDPATGRYNAGMTPSVGSDRLFDFYAQVINGEVANERGDHAVY